MFTQFMGHFPAGWTDVFNKSTLALFTELCALGRSQAASLENQLKNELAALQPAIRPRDVCITHWNVNSCFFHPLLALATLEAGDDQLPHRPHTLGAAHQGDRVPLRLRRGLLLHLPALAHVGQHHDCHSAGGLCHRPGGECPRKVANLFALKLTFMFPCFRLSLAVFSLQYFATKKDETDPRKQMSDPEKRVAGNLFTFWEFEGYLKYSPMFYG